MVDPIALGLPLLAVTLILTCAIAVFTASARRRAVIADVTFDGMHMSALRRARQRAVAAIGASVVVSVVMSTLGLSVAPLLGLPLLLAAPVSASVGLLLYSLVPALRHAVSPSAVRSASLTPRTVASYLSGSLSLPPIIALICLVAFVIVTGVTSSPDDLGLSRAIAFTSPDTVSASSPYAGWFYGLPLLATCVVLVIVTISTMARISATPAFPDPALVSLDTAWRRESMRIVAAIAVFALTLPFGGAAAISGRALLSAVLPTSHPGWTALGIMFVATGLVSVVLSGVSLAFATGHALALPRASLRAAGPAR